MTWLRCLTLWCLSFPAFAGADLAPFKANSIMTLLADMSEEELGLANGAMKPLERIVALEETSGLPAGGAGCALPERVAAVEAMLGIDALAISPSSGWGASPR